jgi:uncharacterized membrane protein
MILDYEEQNPDKFKNTTYESTVDAPSIDEEKRVEYTEGYFKETLLKKKVVVCNLCSSWRLPIFGSLQLVSCK